jgi:hypothetical protein
MVSRTAIKQEARVRGLELFIVDSEWFGFAPREAKALVGDFIALLDSMMGPADVVWHLDHP